MRVLRKNVFAPAQHTTHDTHTHTHTHTLPPHLRSYAVENDVIYLVLCDKGFPKGNAFAYLEDIQQEFGQEHGEEVATQARPYALISFGAIPFPSPVIINVQCPAV